MARSASSAFGGRAGTYAAVIGDSFRAGATGGVLPEGRAGELAGEAFEAEPTLARRPCWGASSADSATRGPRSAAPRMLRVMGRGGFRSYCCSSWRCRWDFRAQPAPPSRQEKADTALVKEAARDDLIALGDNIRALDLDVEMPGVDAEAKAHYGVAVERYEQAEQALDSVRRPQDIERVTSLLEEGRWAMTAAKARLSNQPVPERRAPCFFDPDTGRR